MYLILFYEDDVLIDTFIADANHHYEEHSSNLLKVWNEYGHADAVVNSTMAV